MRRIYCADTRIINFCDVLKFYEMRKWLHTTEVEIVHLNNGHLAIWDKYGIERGLKPNPRAEDLLDCAIEEISPWCVCGDIVIVPMEDYFPDSIDEESAIR